MSFDYLAKQYCALDDKKDSEKCSCINGTFPSELEIRKGEYCKPEIYSVYSAKCIKLNNENFVPKKGKDAFNALKTCTNIYSNGVIADAKGECKDAEDNKFLKKINQNITTCIDKKLYYKCVEDGGVCVIPENTCNKDLAWSDIASLAISLTVIGIFIIYLIYTVVGEYTSVNERLKKPNASINPLAQASLSQA